MNIAPSLSVVIVDLTVDYHYRTVQAEKAAQELPSLVAPISRGLNAAVERLGVLESRCLRLGDAVQAADLEKALARWELTTDTKAGTTPVRR